ncbi:hypothetical protein SAMN02745116_01776 [Pilibacter termitis]|uniref:Uncharacterized protein n=1 Tax=Pilibacter termitis TaxID=263852 RepID=A0A1T4PDR8_9ENTE|nr:hypothetical protein [Pilibacter termitis]SJZ89715.1 hypothetical protein SAMN02745116_01776 [Pilibacter termitis]
MIKVKVQSAFIDKETGEHFKEGMLAEFSSERLDEISKGLKRLNLQPPLEVEEEKPKKKAAKKKKSE